MVDEIVASSTPKAWGVCTVDALGIAAGSIRSQAAAMQNTPSYMRPCAACSAVTVTM